MMRKDTSLYINGILVILSVLNFSAVVVGVHQMQSAEGVGLYWSIVTNGRRELFDVLVDAAAALAFFILVLLPCVFLNHKSISAFFRLLAGFVAFMPRISMSYLIHLFDDGGRGADAEMVLSELGLMLPFACALLMCAGCLEKPWRKWYWGSGAIALIMGVWALWEAQGPGFIMAYALLLVCFDAWERLIKGYSGMRSWGWILFGGLWLRAAYRVIELWSVY